MGQLNNVFENTNSAIASDFYCWIVLAIELTPNWSEEKKLKILYYEQM